MTREELTPHTVVEDDQFIEWVTEGLEKYDAKIQVRVTDAHQGLATPLLVAELAHRLRNHGAHVVICGDDKPWQSVLRISARTVW
jgi:hypothetical protein